MREKIRNYFIAGISLLLLISFIVYFVGALLK